MFDNNEIKNYVLTIFDKQYIVKRYQKIIINGIYYIFLGIFDNERDVPNVTCIYIINNIIKTKYISRPHVSKIKNPNIKQPADIETVGDKQLLKLNINDDDDELMVIMKSILIKKEINIGQFKKMYGEENKTDMNNDKSRLENKNTLSWGKFKFLLNKLSLDYDLIIYDNE